jgi:short-subunit dehydrogenase
MQDKRENVLITGASQGIGLELARVFAKNGYDLILVARDKLKLSEVAKELSKNYKIQVVTVSKDLSEQKSYFELYNSIKKQGIKVDILVNNAGFGNFGNFAETDLSKEESMIDVNVKALTSLTKIFLQDMIKRKSGKILNVASIAAFQPGPLMAVYFATKAYVLSLSEALSEELKDSGVSISALCPGPTASQFQERAGMQNANLFKKKKVMSSEEVAEIGFRGLMKGKRVIIPGFRNKISAFLGRHLPRSLILPIIKTFQE